MKKLSKLSMSVTLITLLLFALSTTVFAQGESGAIVSAGHGSTFVIKNDSSLWGWGMGYTGSGKGYRDPVITPTKVLDNVRSVSANIRTTIAVKKDDTLWGWGSFDGYLNNSQDPTFLTPTKILDDVKIAANGDNYILALKNDNTLWLCGDMVIGDGTNTKADTKVGFVKIMSGIKSMSAGGDTVFVIKEDHTLWGFGSNAGGQLGNMTDISKKVLTATKVLDDVKFVSNSSTTVIAVKLDESLYSWGKGGSKGIYTENGWVKNATSPCKVMDHVAMGTMCTNGSGVLVVKTDGTLWGWNNQWYNEGKKKTPYKYADNVVAVSNGERHSAILKNDGTLWTMGGNYRYGLGYASEEVWYTPITKVLDNIQDVSANRDMTEVEEVEQVKPQVEATEGSFSEIKTGIGKLQVPSEFTVFIEGKSVGADYEYDLKYDVYYKNDNVRIDTYWYHDPVSKSIYNSKDNATYTEYLKYTHYGEYLKGNLLPIRLLDVEFLAKLEIDTEDEFFTARYETLNGEKVLYIESSIKNGVTTKMWYSLKYLIPIKFNEVWIEEGEISTIDWKVIKTEKGPIDDSVFHIPDDAELTSTTKDLETIFEMK